MITVKVRDLVKETCDNNTNTLKTCTANTNTTHSFNIEKKHRSVEEEEERI